MGFSVSIYLTVQLCIVLVVTLTSGLTVNHKAKYYSNTTLACDDTLLGLPYTTFKKFWTLPNGSVVQWSHAPDQKYQLGSFPGFNLTITNIDDADFGWYYCIILWDDYIYLIHSIKIGLNVNGADYESLYDAYKKNAIIGGIAAASTAVVLSLSCLVYWCRYSEVNNENKEGDKEKDKRCGTCKPCSSRTSSSSSISDSENTKDNEEREAIYVLDKAVKGFDEDIYTAYNSDTSSRGAVAVGFDLRRLSENSFKAGRSIFRRLDYNELEDSTSDDALPPPPPLMVDPVEETQVKASVLETYDQLPHGIRTSNSHETNVKAEKYDGIYANPDVEYMNPCSDTKDVLERQKSNNKEQLVDVLDSTEFQDQITDELL